MSACGWGSGGSVGRTFPTQKLAALHTADGRSDCSDSNLSPRCARPVGRSVGSNPDRSRVLWRPPHSLATVPRSTLIAQSHCTEAVCDARVGRSDGCLSTTQCHVMCVQKQRDRELNPGAKGQHVKQVRAKTTILSRVRDVPSLFFTSIDCITF